MSLLGLTVFIPLMVATLFTLYNGFIFCFSIVKFDFKSKEFYRMIVNFLIAGLLWVVVIQFSDELGIEKTCAQQATEC